MEKIRYEVDPHNRLAKTGPDKFRTVVDGEFKVTHDNSLIYHVKKSDNIDVPQQIKFSGNWSLGDKHELVLSLDKWSNQCEGDKLVLQGAVMDASGSELVYSVATRDSSGAEHITLMKFSGAWQADEANRLCFNVEREKGAVDTLAFGSSWTIDRNNEISYSCPENTLTLRGHWDITSKDRLSYVLNETLNSRFDFRVTFDKVLDKGLTFSVGVGAVPGKKTFTLFGRWKVQKGLGLTFEAGCADGQVRSINFGAAYPLPKGQGEAFLKLLASKKEIAIVGGVGFRW